MSGNEWNTQARVMEQVAETLRHEIPVTVLVIEAWSDESTFYIWNDARYSPKPPQEPFKYADFEFPCQGKWPDPKGMIETLHRLGIRVLLWQIPVMKALEAPHPQHDADEAYMIAQGFCVGEQNGEPYRVRPPWFKGGVVLDFSLPRAAAWWLSKRAYLLEELGVDGFKTDGGEHLWGEGVRLFDGSRGATAANRYPNYYVGAYHAFARQKRAGQAITFSRAGFTGCQAYPCHWAGDEDSTWEAFRASILAGLNAGISGIPFWGWDLAGFSGEIPTAELYLRAAAMAAFCPIMQYHSEFNDHRSPCRDRTPWNIQARSGDSQVIPVFRHFANLRMNLLPYLYSEAWKSNRSGVPLMRAMPIEVPADPAVRDFPYQYLLGEALLVAPVVEEGVSSWPVYLPSGWWFDLWTGKGFHGPRVVHCAVPRDIIPVFLRADALLALNLGDEFSLGDAVGNGVTAYRNLCFRVHPRRAARHTWFDMLRAEPVSIEQRPVPGHGGVEFTVERMRHPYTLIIPGLPPRGVKVNGRDLRAAAGPGAALAREGGGWVYDEGKGAALIGVDSHARQRKIEVLGPREA
jgi:alpha-glucosidase (family GH31 glycosyl hydrolase)